MEMMENLMNEVLSKLILGDVKPDELTTGAWERISEEPDLTLEFLEQFSSYLNWSKITIHHKKFTHDEYVRLHRFINWDVLVMVKHVPEDILNRYYKK